MPKRKGSDESLSVSMSYPGDAKMAELLKKYKSQLTLPELKAAVAGAVLTVEMVPPSAVFECLFEDEDSRPDFKDIDEARAWMSALMGLWNEIATKHQTPDKPFLFSKIPNIKENDLKGWVEYTAGRLNELSLFCSGLTEGGYPFADEFEDATSDNILNDLPMVVEATIKALEEELEELIKEDSKDVWKLKSVIEAFDERYLSLYPRFLEQTLFYRNEHLNEIMAAKPQKSSGPKVGRNDPCPCGSGKKFKQCCLQ